MTLEDDVSGAGPGQGSCAGSAGLVCKQWITGIVGFGLHAKHGMGSSIKGLLILVWGFAVSVRPRSLHYPTKNRLAAIGWAWSLCATKVPQCQRRR